MVPVGQVEGFSVQQQFGELRHTGEGEHHLIHLRLAVAPDGDDAVLQIGQHGDHLLGGVVPGQVVPGAVVEQVAQQHQPVRLFPVNKFHQLAAPEGGAVDIGRDNQFHNDTSKNSGAVPRFIVFPNKL